MNSLTVSPTGVEILRAAQRSPASLAELASGLRLSPEELRLDIADLKDKGLAEMDDAAVVHITPKGLNAYKIILKRPDVIMTRDLRGTADGYFDVEMAGANVDLDAAIDQVLTRTRTVQR